jgi:PKHD-type hydroxylase
MIIEIKNIFNDSQDDYDKIKNYIMSTDIKWRDGKETAKGEAKSLKSSLIYDCKENGTYESQVWKDFISYIKNKFTNLKRFDQFKPALPILVEKSFRLNKYDIGQEYGWHTDHSHLGFQAGDRGSPTLTNWAYSIMLHDDFDGGELQIKTDNYIDGEVEIRRWKGSIGDMIIFKTSDLHRVTKVTRGCRIVATGWLSHIIQNTDDLKILIQLNSLINKIIGDSDINEKNKSDYLVEISCIANRIVQKSNQNS